MRRSLVYRLPNGDVKVAYRDFNGRRYWRTMTREEYASLEDRGLPTYDTLPLWPKRRRRG
ncbi:MAG: hypothetical protein QXX19_08845 [Candidatus Caldarchaeum sp.]